MIKKMNPIIRRLLAILIVLTLTYGFATWWRDSHADQTIKELEEKTGVTVLDYSMKKNWAVCAQGEGDADVFFIAPTVDLGSDGNYNMSMDDEETKADFLGAIEMEIGIYNQNAVVYAPYYQQGTFQAYYLDDAEREPYFLAAYQDVKAAFDYYVANCDESRPLILAGFSQGAEMVLRLMKDEFNSAQLQNRLVAAYAIGWSFTKEEAQQYTWVVPAQEETDLGTVILFTSEAEGITDSILVPEGVWTYSINPLNWKTDSTHAPASLNEGACFTNYSGDITEEIPNLTGAYISEERGTLICPDINPEEYSSSLFPEGIYHVYDYQLFYRNLQQNVANRLAVWENLHE